MLDAGKVDVNALLAMGEVAERFETKQRAARETLVTHHDGYLGARSSAHVGSVGEGMKIIASYNLKGGVGKTTAAVNLAYLSSAAGHRTLLWDL